MFQGYGYDGFGVEASVSFDTGGASASASGGGMSGKKGSTVHPADNEFVDYMRKKHWDAITSGQCDKAVQAAMESMARVDYVHKRTEAEVGNSIILYALYVAQQSSLGLVEAQACIVPMLMSFAKAERARPPAPPPPPAPPGQQPAPKPHPYVSAEAARLLMLARRKPQPDMTPRVGGGPVVAAPEPAPSYTWLWIGLGVAVVGAGGWWYWTKMRKPTAKAA